MTDGRIFMQPYKFVTISFLVPLLSDLLNFSYRGCSRWLRLFVAFFAEFFAIALAICGSRLLVQITQVSVSKDL